MALRDFFDEGGFWENNGYVLKVTALFTFIILGLVAIGYISGRC